MPYELFCVDVDNHTFILIRVVEKNCMARNNNHIKYTHDFLQVSMKQSKDNYF
jgi:hypothetical protein